MKVEALHCRFPSIALIFLVVSSAACDPIVTYGKAPGQGGGQSAGEGGQAGAAGADAGVDGGGAGGAGGTGGSGGAGPCADGQMQPCFTGDPATLGIGVCKAGVQTCMGGMFGACIGEVTAANELCNGLDDDCNGAIDDGNPGGGLSCSTGQPGVCDAGTTVCQGGQVLCNANTPASPETCDGLDNDCNGAIDDGNPGGGLTCTTGQPGVCDAGTTVCQGGQVLCNANTPASPETCDGLDNDCNGTIDDGSPGGGLSCSTGQPGVCDAGTTACQGGQVLCNVNATPSPETCDGLDNDCNGTIDDGNPGGGLSCSTGQLGVCDAGTMTCSNGALTCVPDSSSSPEVCDGIDNDCNGQVDEGLSCPPPQINCDVFVGPAGVGAAGNPGTQALPLSTITDAIANAAAIGNGANVCVCDTAAAGPSLYPENVTMVEGVSVYGGFHCADWSRDINTYVTTIQGAPQTWGSGDNNLPVYFPSGITSMTALDGLTAESNMPWLAGDPTQTSYAILIVNSSPSLVDVVALAGQVPHSYGLTVRAENGGTASPTVTRGEYWGKAAYDLGSDQIGVDLQGASGTFTDVKMGGTGTGWTSAGVKCNNCNATIVGGLISGGTFVTDGRGLLVQGNSGGLSVTNTSIKSGVPMLNGVGTLGVEFDNCNGSPMLSGVDIWSSALSNSVYGILSQGAQCAPVISGSTVHAQAGSSSCRGIYCTNDSACVVTNSMITVTGNSSNLAAVDCTTGGCGTFSGNTISAGTASTINGVQVGVRVANANPTFDRNDIMGPACASGTKSANTRLGAAFFSNSTSLLTNNVFREQPCVGPVDVVRFDNASPTLHNNTIQFSTCSGCDIKRGLFVNGSSTASVRNNIFLNAGTSDFANGFAVYEADASSDLQFFENNDLWAPNGGTLYFDEGATPLLLAGINALMGAGGNINANPLLDATFHILPASPCRNAGTATGAPAFDFDGDPRPQEMSYDIGADEYVP